MKYTYSRNILHVGISVDIRAVEVATSIHDSGETERKDFIMPVSVHQSHARVLVFARLEEEMPICRSAGFLVMIEQDS